MWGGKLAASDTFSLFAWRFLPHHAPLLRAPGRPGVLASSALVVQELLLSPSLRTDFSSDGRGGSRALLFKGLLGLFWARISWVLAGDPDGWSPGAAAQEAQHERQRRVWWSCQSPVSFTSFCSL